MMKYLLLLFIFCFVSCQSPSPKKIFRQKNSIKGEYIYRSEADSLFTPPPPLKNPPLIYPWEDRFAKKIPMITKEYFRCKGSTLNPPKTHTINDSISYLFDCGGSEKHSLPLQDNKEFIYPILIDLLNYIQDKTNKKVVITSGHRCPDHNSYVDPSPQNQYSKHMIGAEVSFYVQGLELQPDYIIKLLQNYFSDTPSYQNKNDFLEFQRYEKDDSHTLTKPWMNKEIFIKLFTKKEGRNFDNRHPYPYISIQVRYDKEKKERVIYTWNKAQHNFLRK